ncbi:MAG: CotH kinase family protein, partial [Clostridia bacterium]|nr:CotH kinase family protein [Clostridia bacterium]
MKKQVKILSLIFSACLCMTAAAPALSVYGEEPSVEEILADNNIPVVYISIDENAEGYCTIEEMNSSPDHSSECTGTVQIDVPEGYKGDYSDEILADTDELKLEYIRGRGHTTWMEDKKPYKFKLDKKADLLGMGKNKHWTLLANAFDETLLRNKLTYYMGEQLGLDYTPKSMAVDVVMNGEYLGSYLLCEQVMIGESRVGIDQLTPEDNDEPEITGGYLFSIPEGNEAPENLFTTEKGVTFAFQDPQFTDDETGTPEQKTYISEYLQEAENAIFSGNASEYMDLQSAADYWWVQVFTQNQDAYITDSTILYKPRNDKIYWGPLWDFDLALGKTYTQTDGFNFRLMLWLDYLRENDPDYLDLLLERWTALDGIITNIVKDGGVLDSYVSEIRNSWEDNRPLSRDPDWEMDEVIENLRTWMTERQTWINENLDKLRIVRVTLTFMADNTIVEQRTVNAGFPMSQSYPDAPKKDGFTFVGWEPDGDMDEGIEALRAWMTERQTWINENLDKLGIVRVTLTFMADDTVVEQRTVNAGFPVSQQYPDAPKKDGFTFVGWEPDVEVPVNENDLPYFWEDVTFTANYLDNSQSVKADNIWFEKDEFWADINDYYFYPMYVITPDNAEIKDVVWSSSDNDTAEFSEYGMFQLKKTGDAVLTATVNNEFSKSLTIHIYDGNVTPAQD